MSVYKYIYKIWVISVIKQKQSDHTEQLGTVAWTVAWTETKPKVIAEVGVFKKFYLHPFEGKMLSDYRTFFKAF